MILLAYPNKSMISHISDDNYIYFDGHNFAKMNGEAVSHQNIEKIEISSVFQKISILYKINYTTIRRWRDSKKINETSFALDLIRILNIYVDLVKIEVKTVIFFTESPHHINTIFLDIACEVAKVNRVYLKLNKVNGELIPMYTTKSISELKLLPFNTNKKIIDINDYIDRIKNNKLDLVESKVKKRHSKFHKNYLFTLTYILSKNLKWNIYNLFRKNNQEIPNIFGEIELLNNQKNYIKGYIKKSQKKITTNEKHNALIFAHFQPESSTFPLGFPFYNHLNVIDILKKLGFNKIFYK